MEIALKSALEKDSYAQVRRSDPVIAGGVGVKSLPDEELLRRCAKGQDAAMQELIRRYQAPLYRFLSRYLWATEDTEQAVLNVFIRAWQHAPRFRFRSQVSTWLYRIAINIAHDLHKGRRVRPPAEPWPPSLEVECHSVGNAEHEAFQRLERENEFQVLHGALNQMSEVDRLVLILYYFEECTYEEIQEIAQLSYKVLKTRLTRARQRLRSLVDIQNKKASQ